MQRHRVLSLLKHCVAAAAVDSAASAKMAFPLAGLMTRTQIHRVVAALLDVAASPLTVAVSCDVSAFAAAAL